MSTARRLETRDDMMEEIERLQGCLNQTAEIERENSLLKARIAELEGARAKMRNQRDSGGLLTIVATAMDGLCEMECDCGHEEPCSRCIAIAAIEAQAAELERLRADLATAQQISRDLIAAADRAPAQAEPQDCGGDK